MYLWWLLLIITTDLHNNILYLSEDGFLDFSVDSVSALLAALQKYQLSVLGTHRL